MIVIQDWSMKLFDKLHTCIGIYKLHTCIGHVGIDYKQNNY